jgi:hypothetical protein
MFSSGPSKAGFLNRWSAVVLCAQGYCCASGIRWQLLFCEISSSHGGEYEVQICLLGCTAV